VSAWFIQYVAIIMKRSAGIVLVVLLTCVAVDGEPELLPRVQLEEGWVSLFDGETLFGWQPVGDAKWEVVDGEIRTIGDKAGWLMTTTEWADFELRAEFRAPAKTNSGIFLRTSLQPTDPTKDCIEVNIAPRDNPYPTPSQVGRLKSSAEDGGWIRQIGRQGYRKAMQRLNPWDGKWHALNITLKGASSEVALDDVIMSAYMSEGYNYGELKKRTLRRGHIGLQSREGPVAFRNIRLRPLGLQSLFDGKDLNGWSQRGAEKCKFDATSAGELHLTNGPGQIETEKDFTNFVLQLECKVNGDGLNSGIFFRTLRNGRWAGYESQIHNGFKEGDRTKPKDYGTGAIYRRQPARRIVADDHKWFAKTIVADGPHVAVWVNGYQVSDWTDTRPAKESGREGLRLGGGAIAIQGHDKTTDLLFRNIRAAELPAETTEVNGKRTEVGGQRSRN
jgi:hypothetical protein